MNVTFDTADQLFNQKQYSHATSECGRILCRILVEAYQETLPQMSPARKRGLIDIESEIGGGKPVADLELGKLIAILSRARLFPEIAKDREQPLTSFNPEALNEINRLRIDAEHHGYNPTKKECTFVVTTTKQIAFELGHYDFAKVIASSDGTSDTASTYLSVPTTESIAKRVTLSNLPKPEYIEFVGRGSYIEEVTRYLEGRPYVVSIDGIGGVGKSALALEVARRCWERGRFRAIIWVSAKQKRLRVVGIEDVVPTLADYESLLDTIAAVLGFQWTEGTPGEKKEAAILDALGRLPILLVIDNLETIEDDRISSFIKDLPAPTKALITSRKRLGEVERVVLLKQFSSDESLELLDVEAKAKSITLEDRSIAFRQLHQASGGIPLALKIAVGWLSQGRTVREVVERFKKGEGQLLDFCFEESYQKFMDDDTRRIFSVFPVLPEKSTIEQVGVVSGLGVETASSAIAKLLSLSLLNQVEGPSDDDVRRVYYSMLPLTLSYAQLKLEGDRGTEKEARRRWARYLLRHRRTTDALRQYSASLEDLGGQTETGRTAALLANAGLATYQRGNYNKARDFFEQAIQTDPRLSYSYQMWATVERQQGHHARADELFRRASELNPRNPIIWTSWAMLKREEGDLIASEALLRRALAARGIDDPSILHQLSVVLGLMGQFTASLREGRKGLIDPPRSNADRAINSALLHSASETLFRWSQWYEKKKNLAVAQDKLEEALRALSLAERIGQLDRPLRVQQKKLHKALAHVLTRREMLDQAVVELRNALWTPPVTDIDIRHNHEVTTLLATALKGLGKNSELIALCKSAASQFKDPRFLKFIPGEAVTL